LPPVEKLRNIAKKHNWLILALGIVLGAFIVMPSQQNCSIQIDEMEEAAEEAPVTVSETIEAVPSVSQASVERTSYLIEVLPDFNEGQKEEAPKMVFLPSPTKVFKVLFEHIISPNSP
jgi:hypothetical protein